MVRNIPWNETMISKQNNESEDLTTEDITGVNKVAASI